MNIIQALDDPNIFGRWFRDKTTWAAWRSFLAALFGLPMDTAQKRVFRECTGRSEAPRDGVNEAWLIIGRRGGKSFVLALIAVFLACFRDWRPHLGPGERATVTVLASDRRQARVILRYVKGLLKGVPMLSGTIESETADSVDLMRCVTIEVHSASFRSVRGYTIVAALCDELAFWRSDESANPDTEILNALRPAMATVPGAMLLCASSPYARRGALWRAWKTHKGQEDGRVLVWQAPTRTMNPTVPQRAVDQAYEEDPSSAAAEYGAQFRQDVEGYVAPEVIDAVTVPGRLERPRVLDVTYLGFVDPSGGSRDSMTLAVAHWENDRAVLDCVRERRAPFSPDAVTAEFAEVLKSYGLTSVTGDRYGGEWPRERFREYRIDYEIAEHPKSQLYGELLPALNSGTVELLDVPRLAAQLGGLERRTSRAGKDSIDHAPGGHDDVSNAVAGVLVMGLDRARRPLELEDQHFVLGRELTAGTNFPGLRGDDYHDPGDWNRAPWDL